MDNNQKFKVSTNSITLFNSKQMMLKICFLEEALTVSICEPYWEGSKLTYPIQNRHNVLLNPTCVSAMVQMIHDIIIPSYEKKEKKDVGVFSNRSKTQMLETVTDGGILFAVIHNDISERKPKNSYIFEFDKTEIITDYNIETLDYNHDMIDASFAVYVKALESFDDLCSGVTAHMYQYRQNYFLDQMRKLITALDTKFNLGIAYRNGNYSNSGFGNYNQSNNNSGSFTNIEVQESTMDGIMGQLGGEELPFA